MTEQATSALTMGRVLSWEEYQDLPEDPRVEYIDGHLVVSPSRTGRHQKISLRLAFLLEAAVPVGYDVNVGWSWKPARDEFIPDVMVFPLAETEGLSDARFTGLPAMLVEILSSNRGDDLVYKAGKYAAAGLPNYWVVDPRDDRLTAYVLQDGIFVPETVLGRGDVGELDFGVGRVNVDLDALLG